VQAIRAFLAQKGRRAGTLASARYGDVTCCARQTARPGRAKQVVLAWSPSIGPTAAYSVLAWAWRERILI